MRPPSTAQLVEDDRWFRLGTVRCTITGTVGTWLGPALSPRTPIAVPDEHAHG